MSDISSNIETERIVLLDDDWQPIGEGPKLASHHADTPLHLAISCHVFNENGEVLITRRAVSKKVWPGVWTNSCCGHPAPSETMEAAVIRRLQYELGLAVTDLRLVLPKFRYRCEFQGIVENECCPVYVALATSAITANPDEVEAYEWVTWEAFEQRTTSENSEFSYWCKLQVPLLADQGIGSSPSN